MTSSSNPIEDAQDNELFGQLSQYCMNEPQGFYINTVGVVHFRMKEYQRCVDWLQKSLHLNQQKADFPIPGDTAFLAMSHLKLGNIDEANKYRKLFEDAMKAITNPTAENLGFAKEVEAAFGTFKD